MEDDSVGNDFQLSSSSKEVSPSIIQIEGKPKRQTLKTRWIRGRDRETSYRLILFEPYLTTHSLSNKALVQLPNL